MHKKKILMVAPSFPYPLSGAEQADRAEGIKQLVRLGCEVTVIAKVVEWADHNELQRVAREWGIQLVLVPYRYSNRAMSLTERLFKHLGKLRNLLYLDGAAYEFTEPMVRAALVRELGNKPDVVWFEYTYLWPLYTLVKAAGIPIVTRSINFEPLHFLEESGRSLLNYLLYIPKYFGERRTVRMSSVVFAITPAECVRYTRWGAKTVALPLRSLPSLATLPLPALYGRVPLNAFFMGSSYNVSHNREAAAFIINEVAPLLGGGINLHIIGGKLPPELAAAAAARNVTVHGYVEDLSAFLATMDVALIPSLSGAGMQQKVFEPIVRGIPTVTSLRAIAGYPLVDGTDFVGAKSAAAFAEALATLTPLRRQALSTQGSAHARALFSQEALDAIVRDALQI